jgi:hypothetical protein
MGVGGQCHALATLPREREPVPIIQEAGWVLGPVWTGVEYLAPLVFDPQTVQLVASCYTTLSQPMFFTYVPSLKKKKVFILHTTVDHQKNSIGFQYNALVN